MSKSFPIEQCWQFLLKTLRRGVWVLDEHGNVIEANPAIERWTECSEMTGKPASRWAKYIVLTDRGTGEIEITSESGLTRRCEVLSENIHDANGKFVATIQIITDQVMARALEGRLVEEVQRMAKLAGEDPLTGLANRRAFDEGLLTMQSDCERKFGVVVIDLDDFKAVNDSFGHKLGDKVLVAFAQKLLQIVRSDDLVARIGGDEFAILMPNINMSALTEAADRLRNMLIVETQVKGKKLGVYASVGYAHSGPDPMNVVERADKWMYQNKSVRESGGLVSLAEQEAKFGEGTVKKR